MGPAPRIFAQTVEVRAPVRREKIDSGPQCATIRRDFQTLVGAPLRRKWIPDAAPRIFAGAVGNGAMSDRGIDPVFQAADIRQDCQN